MATKIRRTVCVRSFTTTQGKTLTPGARRQIERFYCQIDWDLGEEEREFRRKAKKARRKAKRRIRRLLKDATSGGDPKLRAEAQIRIIDLLAGKDPVHA